MVATMKRPAGPIKNGRAARATHDTDRSEKASETIHEAPGDDNANAKRSVTVLSGELMAIPVSHCERHPDNRRPTDDRIERMAHSLHEEKQLEPIIVRRLPPAPGQLQYQIISGETRWRSALKLGWNFLDGRVVECDDARALELLAIYNAAREDLNPIEKALMIERLCQPVAKGGGGMTREAAAAIYGLESGGAASNLVRLLELPRVWQQRVASGELPQTFARAILPCVEAPKLLDQLESSWKQCRDEWDSRAGVEHVVEFVIDKFTRPIEAKDTHTYRGSDLGGDWTLSDDYPLMFEVTDELQKDLEIVELEIDGKKVRRATNAKLYDKHQVPAIKKHVADRRIKEASKASKGKAGTKKPLSAADQKRRDEDLARQLENRIKRWRHSWLKQLVAARLVNDGGWQTAEIALWLIIHHGNYDFNRDELLVAAAGKKVNGYLDDEGAWKIARTHVAGSEDPEAAGGELIIRFCASVLGTEERNPDFPFIPFEVLDAVAGDLAIDLDEEWKGLQRSTAKDPRFTEFLELHQSSHLDELGEFWGVYLQDGTPKGQKIRLLSGQARVLKRPVSIAAVGKTNRKRKAKAK